MVFIVRNSLACVEQPTVSPSSITTMSFSAEPAVLARRVVLPDSFSRFPKNSIPSSGSPDGTMNVVSSSPIIGNRIRSVCDTLRGDFMRISRSLLVVMSFIMNGCITGTSAMYEYAHTASGVGFVKLMNLFLPKDKKINPLIGNAGVSAVPMSARISNNVGLEYDRRNFLLMHAMGPNVAGVIGSAVAAGALLGFLK